MKLVRKSTERPPQGGRSSTHMWFWKAQGCASLDSPTSLCFPWHKGLPTRCTPPAASMLKWPGARAATAELAGGVLFVDYFRTHLCSLSSRAVGPPCLSSLGCPAHLSISRHVGLSLVALDHMKILLVTPVVVGPRVEFLTQLRPACITLVCILRYQIDPKYLYLHCTCTHFKSNRKLPPESTPQSQGAHSHAVPWWQRRCTGCCTCSVLEDRPLSQQWPGHRQPLHAHWHGARKPQDLCQQTLSLCPIPPMQTPAASTCCAKELRKHCYSRGEPATTRCEGRSPDVGGMLASHNWERYLPP